MTARQTPCTALPSASPHVGDAARAVIAPITLEQLAAIEAALGASPSSAGIANQHAIAIEACALLREALTNPAARLLMNPRPFGIYWQTFAQKTGVVVHDGFERLEEGDSLPPVEQPSHIRLFRIRNIPLYRALSAPYANAQPQDAAGASA